MQSDSVSPRILLIEDQSALTDLLSLYFEQEGYEIVCTASGEEGLFLSEESRPDLIMLDISLSPEGRSPSGYDICAELRRRGYERPIIFLTGSHDESATLRGFAVGGDDYVTKPVSLPVLKARIEAHLKRVGVTQRAYRFGDVEIDLERYLIHHPDRSERLRNRERDLLRCFLESRGRILTREALLQQVWGNAGRTSNRTVDTHVRTLRKKLRDDASEPRFIETLHGVGYQFIARAEE